LGIRCIRIHGQFEPEQKLILTKFLQHQQLPTKDGTSRLPTSINYWCGIVCRDYVLLGQNSCERGARCSYRHLQLDPHELSPFSVCALLWGLYQKITHSRFMTRDSNRTMQDERQMIPLVL
jgi:hypothetical protein